MPAIKIAAPHHVDWQDELEARLDGACEIDELDVIAAILDMDDEDDHYYDLARQRDRVRQHRGRRHAALLMDEDEVREARAAHHADWQDALESRLA